jgi:hypothetical protein
MPQSKVSLPENERVRVLARDEVALAVEADETGHSPEKKRGRAIRKLADDWRAIHKKLEIPGEIGTERTHDHANWRPGAERRGNTAGTILRKFLQGEENLYEYHLIGIESAICDRHGSALPGKAYRSQRRLDLPEAAA